ncbi:MAG: BTAD domain-containing putative transcriptional regulator [Chloroflexota bacterium]
MSEIQNSYPLIHNKVTSPHYVTPTLRRARLLDWLIENSGCRALVLAADAGYGKTTLLWQWEREADFPCYWYKLDRNDRDWTLHVRYLIEAINQRHPGFGRKTSSMLRQLGGPASSRPGVAAFLLGEMHERLTEPCTFIIDDWQFVNSVTEVRGLWNQILRDAPPTCRFVFASRVRPRLQFARFKTHSGYAQLGTDALRMTDGEIGALFRDVYDDPLDPNELAELERRTEGWAASLQLIEVSLRERQTVDDRRTFIRSITATTDSDLFAFLAEEVLDQQTDETRNFLLSTSILQQITPDLAERLAGVHEGARRLLELERSGLFTYRLDEARYRYHGLFRDFLERRLRMERSEAEVLGLHIHAASYFETTERWPEAIHHYLKAGLKRQAARLIARYGEDVVAGGQIGLVDEWIEQLPEQTVRENARLSLLSGEALGMRGEWSAALSALQRSRDYFSRKGDRRLMALACLKLSTVHHVKGDPDTASAMATEGLSLVPDDDRVTRLRLEGNLLISSRWQQESVDELKVTCNRIVAEAAAMGLDHFAAIGLHNLGILHRESGRLQESLAVLERAWRIWQLSSPSSPFADNMELVLTLLGVGGVDRAEQLAQAGMAMTAAWPRPHLEALCGRALVHAFRDEFQRGIQLLSPFVNVNTDLGQVSEYCSAFLLELMILQGGYALEVESIAALMRSRPLDPRRSAATMTALALARHAGSGCGPTCGTESRKQLDDADGRGALETAIAGKVKLGIIDLDHRKAGAAHEAIVVLERAAQLGLTRILRPWVRKYGTHVSQLVSARGGPGVVARLLDEDPTYWRSLIPGVLGRVSGESRSVLLGALARHANRELTEGLRAVAGSDVAELRRNLVQQQAPRLFVRSFGPLVIHLGGWEGRIVHVPKRRVRMLLAVLVAYAGQALTRDMVLELLWPEADPGAAVNSLNQTVFQLRRLVDPTYRDGDSPLYVISTSETVQFNRDLVRTDLSEFRRLVAQLTLDRPLSSDIASALLSLIRGEFLSDVRYEDWAWNLATGVHNEVRTALLPVATNALRAGGPELGVRAACALVVLDPFDELAQIALADRLAEGGRRSAARESISEFSRRLRDELDEEPSSNLAEAMTRLGVPEVASRLTELRPNPARA